MERNRKSFILITCAVITWIAAVGYGLVKMWSYDSTPGRLAKSSNWPDASSSFNPLLKLANGQKDTLVMLAHPRCPCTRASVENLARVMALAKGRLNAFVIIYEPKIGSGPQWEHSGLVQDANRIPGVTTILDPRGSVAALFHGRTSGQTFLYDSSGRLLFNGGITGQRGVAGDSAGTDAVESLAMNGNTSIHTAPVFGCALIDDNQTTASTNIYHG